MKRICMLCRDVFECDGECKEFFDTEFFEGIIKRKDACYCPRCAKSIVDKYSDSMKAVCPRFNVMKEKVIFT